MAADADMVAIAQLCRLANLDVVDECAVAAAQVHDAVDSLVEAQQGVPARGELIAFQHDVTGWRPPDGDIAAVQHVLALRLLAIGMALVLCGWPDDDTVLHGQRRHSDRATHRCGGDAPAGWGREGGRIIARPGLAARRGWRGCGREERRRLWRGLTRGVRCLQRLTTKLAELAGIAVLAPTVGTDDHGGLPHRVFASWKRAARSELSAPHPAPLVQPFYTITCDCAPTKVAALGHCLFDNWLSHVRQSPRGILMS